MPFLIRAERRHSARVIGMGPRGPADTRPLDRRFEGGLGIEAVFSVVFSGMVISNYGKYADLAAVGC